MGNFLTGMSLTNGITITIPTPLATKAIFGYGQTAASTMYSMTNLVSSVGVVATDTTGVGTIRQGLGASSYS